MGSSREARRGVKLLDVAEYACTVAKAAIAAYPTLALPLGEGVSGERFMKAGFLP